MEEQGCRRLSARPQERNGLQSRPASAGAGAAVGGRLAFCEPHVQPGRRRDRCLTRTRPRAPGLAREELW